MRSGEVVCHNHPEVTTQAQYLHPNESETEEKAACNLRWKSTIISQNMYCNRICSVLSLHDEIFIVYRWFWLYIYLQSPPWGNETSFTQASDSLTLLHFGRNTLSVPVCQLAAKVYKQLFQKLYRSQFLARKYNPDLFGI